MPYDNPRHLRVEQFMNNMTQAQYDALLAPHVRKEEPVPSWLTIFGASSIVLVGVPAFLTFCSGIRL